MEVFYIKVLCYLDIFQRRFPNKLKSKENLKYRKLLKNERLLLVVDKPLVRSMPELHDDSDDYLLNNHGIPNGMHKYIPQKQTKSISKNDIVNENFNIKI